MSLTRQIEQWLMTHAGEQHCLFTLRQLSLLCEQQSEGAFKTLLSRAVQAGWLMRVCRGLYAYRDALPADGLLLFHAAVMLRADAFNYISLETALSDAGVISQVPINYITVMSSGRSNTIDCGNWGTIEFVHTAQRPNALREQLSYDPRCGLWRASVAQALRDMTVTRRVMDLVDWDVAHEFI